MRFLVVYAHPVKESFVSALHDCAVAALRSAGHEVDDCDLYAEGFQPVLAREARIDYHNTSVNRGHASKEIERLLACNGLVLVYPTWWYGLPSSSSHALIGGFVGAGIAAAGPKAIIVKGIVKIAWFIVLSPLIGMALGFILMFLVTFLFRRATPHRVHGLFRWLQFVSSSAFSLGHGGNDAQKTIGMIAALLYSTGYLHGEFHVPLWVVIAAQTAIGLGTMVGGWRIVHTMGMKVTKLRVEGGFCAQAAGAITLIGATLSGIPVSTTHTITGAIMGVGSTRRLSAVRWGVAGGIVWAWLLTIPASAVMSAISFLVLRIFWRT